MLRSFNLFHKRCAITAYSLSALRGLLLPRRIVVLQSRNQSAPARWSIYCCVCCVAAMVHCAQFGAGLMSRALQNAGPTHFLSEISYLVTRADSMRFLVFVFELHVSSYDRSTCTSTEANGKSKWLPERSRRILTDHFLLFL